MGRPKKGSRDPVSPAIAGRKADHAKGIADKREAKRRAADKAKADNADNLPAVQIRRLLSGRKKSISDADVISLARQVARDGVSLVDCAVDALLLDVRVEEMRAQGVIDGDKYVTSKRQILKLRTDLAAAYRDQGDPLPDRVTVTLDVTGATAAAAASPFPQADGGTGDALEIH